MAERVRITYATMSADNPKLHADYEEGMRTAKSWLGQKHQFYVNGEAREGEGYDEERSPIDRDIVIGYFARATRQDAKDAIEAARKFFPKWSGTPWDERVKIMRQAADVAGAHGLTFLLLLGNDGLLAATRAAMAGGPASIRIRRACTPAAAVAALVLALVLYGAWRSAQLAAGGRHDHVADAVVVGLVGMVQADISHYDRLRAEVGTFQAVRTIVDAHFALSAEALRRADLDFLVWPETVYPTTFGAPKSEDGAAFDREIGAFVARAGVPLVFGAYDTDGRDEFNAAVFLEPAAHGPLAFETYRKTWLFPLTERLPPALDSERVRRWLPWLGTWKPGAGPKVIPLSLRDGRTLRIAPLICYDAAVPSFALAAIRGGADLIVTLSNDSWFTYGDVPRLILIVSAFRSIETRRPQVRATNTGISAVVTATGDLLATAGVHERAAVVATVTPEPRAMTLMLAWGDWFGPTALGCGVVLLAAPLATRRRSDSSTEHGVAV